MVYHEDDKVDVPADFYEEPILFDEDKPEQLSEIYTMLEEQNLKKIIEFGDEEEQLDVEKARQQNIHDRIGRDIDVQMQLQREINKKIQEETQIL